MELIAIWERISLQYIINNMAIATLSTVLRMRIEQKFNCSKQLVDAVRFKLCIANLFRLPHNEPSGFHAILDVHADEYSGAFAQEYGVRVSIHAPKELSYAQADGFTISPGESAHVDIRCICIKSRFSYGSKLARIRETNKD